MGSGSGKQPQPRATNERGDMDELLTLAIGKLADHYQVSEDCLKRALLLRAVAELNAVTDRTKPATPEELDAALTSMSRRLDEFLEGLRQQLVQADDAVHHASLAIAMADRVTAILRTQVETPPRPSAPANP